MFQLVPVLLSAMPSKICEETILNPLDEGADSSGLHLAPADENSRERETVPFNL